MFERPEVFEKDYPYAIRLYDTKGWIEHGFKKKEEFKKWFVKKIISKEIFRANKKAWSIINEAIRETKKNNTEKRS